MKIKDAIAILQSFKSVAGEDTEIDAERFNLVAKMEAQYHSVGYGHERDQPTYKLVYYITVTVLLRDVPSVGNICNSAFS